jgi:hypothetical protein
MGHDIVFFCLFCFASASCLGSTAIVTKIFAEYDIDGDQRITESEFLVFAPILNAAPPPTPPPPLDPASIPPLTGTALSQARKQFKQFALGHGVTPPLAPLPAGPSAEPVEEPPLVITRDDYIRYCRKSVFHPLLLYSMRHLIFLHLLSALLWFACSRLSNMLDSELPREIQDMRKEYESLRARLAHIIRPNPKPRTSSAGSFSSSAAAPASASSSASASSPAPVAAAPSTASTPAIANDEKK